MFCSNCTSPLRSPSSARFFSHGTTLPGGRAPGCGEGNWLTCVAAYWVFVYGEAGVLCPSEYTPYSRVNSVMARDVVHTRVVLHDRAGVHNVSAVASHTVDYLLTVCPYVLGRSKRQQEVGNPATQAELVSQGLWALKMSPWST